jgi:hypothetical protein
VDANARDLEYGGTVTAIQRSFGTILVDPSALLLDGLKLILANTDFQVVASGCTVEELDLHGLQEDRPLLFILGAGHDPGTAVRQVEWCPSSDNLRLIRLFAKGGSGSSGFRV